MVFLLVSIVEMVGFCLFENDLFEITPFFTTRGSFQIKHSMLSMRPIDITGMFPLCLQ